MWLAPEGFFSEPIHPSFRFQVHPLITDPRVAAGCIEINIRAKVRQHQRLAEKAGAEVRHNEAHLWIGEGDRMQVEWIGKSHVEWRPQPEFLTDSDRQHAAMDKDRAAVRRSPVEQRLDPGIMHGESMHG